jgi:hypothetical protein
MGDVWQLDEVFVKIEGNRQDLWHAVDQDGDAIDILAQRHRNARAAKRFCRGCPQIMPEYAGIYRPNSRPKTHLTLPAPLTFVTFLTNRKPITQILDHIGEPISPPLPHPAPAGSASGFHLSAGATRVDEVRAVRSE